MKKLITSRRGVAIELAIGVLLVMSALGIILVTNASLQNKEMKSDVSRFEQKIELYEITDYIIENRNFEGQYPSNDNYSIDIDDADSNKYTVTKDGNTVLTIVFKNDGSIESWN